MILNEDRIAFTAITGLDRITPEFEAEYERWIRMHHRNKRQGPLGDLMTPLLASLGLYPPPEIRRTEERINWANVQGGTRVTIKTDDGQELHGAFLKVVDYGMLEVKLDGVAMTRAFSRLHVTLSADANGPISEDVPQVEDTRLQVKEAVYRGNERDELPTYNPEVHDPHPTETAPELKNTDLYRLQTGAKLIVEHDGDTPDAQFLRVGPNDNEVTVWIDGHDSPVTVSEDAVVVEA